MDSRKHLHFGLRLSFLSLLTLAACGDSGSAETSAGPTTAATDMGTSTGNTTGTGTNPTTGPTSGSAGWPT